VSRAAFVGALVAGALLRAAALPLPGTRDVGVWKIWTYNAARESPARLYGTGGRPPERRILEFHGAEATVDYPPLALDELALVGRVYRRLNPRFPDTAALTCAIKMLLVAFEGGLAVLAYRIVRRHAGLGAARWAVAAYWLNPAPLFDAGILGYLDALFVLPLAAALAAAAARRSFAAGALAAIAAATKAQAIVALPAVALAVWTGGSAGSRADDSGRNGRLRRIGLAAAGAGTAAAAILAPVARAGSLANLAAAMQSLGRHDMLSGNACNFWWIVGWALRVRYSLDRGFWAAATAPARILAISRTIEIGYPNPRIVGALLAGSAAVWGLWTARRARDPFLVAGLGAFLVHAYATLSAQVHENHLYAAIPLLVIAAAGRPRLRPVMWTVSAIFALNLNAFYGVSEYIDGWAVPRGITGLDLTIILAVANCAALGWHARRFAGECTVTAPARPPAARAAGGPLPGAPRHLAASAGPRPDSAS